MTQRERIRMYAANCRCCLLAANMRDCGACLFQQPVAVQVSAAYGDAWLAEAQADAADWADWRATNESARP